MGIKSDIDHQCKHSVSENNITRNVTSADDTLPIYYDSEPSSQPPRYSNNQTIQIGATPTSSANLTAPTTKPPNQHRNSAPASTIHAILASPHVDLDAERRAKRRNKTLRQRWRDFKDRNFHDDYEDDGRQATGASGPELNVLGARLKGGVTTPYKRKDGK
jgi:hypothetical protein